MSSQITEQELDKKIIPVLKQIVLGYLESQIVFNKMVDLHSVIYEDDEILPIENKYVITRRISNNITFRVKMLFRGNDFVHNIAIKGDNIIFNNNVNNEQLHKLKETIYELNGSISESNVRDLIEKGFVNKLEYILDTVLDLTKIDDFHVMIRSHGIRIPYSSIVLNEFSHRSPNGIKHYVGNGSNVKELDLRFNLDKNRLHLYFT